jgi:hypothetical protein
MRWEDERYVRVYVRDTAEWLALGWQAQALLILLLRKADRAGIVHTGKAGVRGLAALVAMPLEVVTPAVEALLSDGCLRSMEGGYVFPNFLAAQEAKSSDAQRKREQRARDREKALAGGSAGSHAGMDAEAAMSRAAGHTPGHASRPVVTQDGHAVPDNVTASVTTVTPSRAVPCLAVPSASQAPSAQPLVLAVQDASQPPAEKPKRPPTSSALGEFIDWARETVRPRLPEGAPDVAAMAQHQRVKLGEAVKLHGLAHVKAAFRLFMGWEGAATKGYALGLFASGWEGWVRQAIASPGTTKRTQGPAVSGVDEFDQDIPGGRPARSTA